MWKNHQVLDHLIQGVIKFAIMWGWSRHEIEDRVRVEWLNQTGTTYGGRMYNVDRS